MSRMKYPRDEKGRVILGTQYGITIPDLGRMKCMNIMIKLQKR